MAFKVIAGGPITDRHGMRINWGSVFCGAFLILGLGVFFLFLGNAVGLSMLNILATDTPTGLRLGSWVYIAVTLVGAFYSGGYLASRLARMESRLSGALHALTSWAVATFTFITIALMMSAGAGLFLMGAGSDVANWLMLTIVAVGGVVAMLGGMLGSVPIGIPLRAPEELPRERRTA